jgi:nucleotide-binding universal stress UspA family protein
MIANILVPLDGSALSERALPYATALARRANARLRLYHVTTDIGSPADIRAELDIEARTDEIASQLRAQGIQATAVSAPVYLTVQAILSAATNPPADLIVMSTHGRGGLGRWLYGSVADEVLSQADVPVLLVSAACHHPWPEDRPLKILVPLDGSDLSEAALGPARLLSHTLEANLLLLRVIEEDADADWRFEPEHLAIDRTSPPAIEVAQQYLQEFAEVTGPITSAVDMLVDTGDPSVAIAATAEKEGVDLIVMATHGRTGLARLTMGSVATTTLQRANVPILLIRPAGLERSGVEPAGEGPDKALPEAWPPIGTRA